MKQQYRGFPYESTDRVLKTVESGIRAKYRGITYVVEPMGFLYKVYCIGWRNGNGSLKRLPPLQHWLLSIFVYYRKGYTDGSKQRQQYRNLQHLETRIQNPAVS